MANLILHYGESGQLDVSRWINQRKDLEETPVYINGENAGMSKAGTRIRDRKKTLYDASFPVVIVPKNVMTQILKACEASPQMVRYDSATEYGTTVTKPAEVSVSPFRFAYELDGTKYYQGAVISVEANQ